MGNPTVKIVVPWHNAAQIESFRLAWNVDAADPRFVFQHDKRGEGCGRTKNAGIEAAMNQGAEVVIVLDDDCYPAGQSVDEFIAAHLLAMKPQQVEMFKQVTIPASRGTPYSSRKIEMPVAASIGFWTGVPDYDAASQLVHGGKPMVFDKFPVFGQYFALCGMNIAFRPAEWLPWCSFIDVPRFDDIWAGWLWQKEAYRRGHCFNLNGPMVHHVRQSNVWKNLRHESQWLEQNERLWAEIAASKETSYFSLRGLLPV